ncbi:MAG: glycosyltransferase family 1 protein, partial [Armatimonadetes bacterium CG07_land_8_20_14_0_80_40_9]
TATQQHISTTDTQTNIKFLIVGDGPLREELKEQSKDLGIEDEVTFTGSRQDIPEIMAALDIFVLTSIKEHFGRVVIEAMACGKPVIATNSGAVPEIVEDKVTGILVPPEDSEKLAEAIIELLEDKEKAKEMGIAGRKRVEELFSIEKHTRQIEEVYLSLLSS